MRAPLPPAISARPHRGSRRFLTIALIAQAWSGSGCKDSQTQDHRPTAASPPPKAAVTSKAPPRPNGDSAHGSAPSAPPPKREPETILAQPHSAYGLSIELDEDATYVLSPMVLYRIGTEGSNDEKEFSMRQLPLGVSATLHGDDVYYWSDGAIHAVPKHGGAPRKITPVSTQPQHIVAGAAGLAWIRRREHDSVLERKDEHGAVELLSSNHRLISPVMLDDRIFVVAAPTPSRYQILGVSMDGGNVSESEARTGRTPSMLAAHEDHLHHYDGPSRSVQRLGFELKHREAISDKTICSPIAVGEVIACASVGGVFIVDEATQAVHPLAEEPGGLITAIATRGNRVTWAVDVGQSGVAIRTITTTEPPG